MHSVTVLCKQRYLAWGQLQNEVSTCRVCVQASACRCCRRRQPTRSCVRLLHSEPHDHVSAVCFALCPASHGVWRCAGSRGSSRLASLRRFRCCWECRPARSTPALTQTDRCCMSAKCHADVAVAGAIAKLVRTWGPPGLEAHISVITSSPHLESIGRSLSVASAQSPAPASAPARQRSNAAFASRGNESTTLGSDPLPVASSSTGSRCATVTETTWRKVSGMPGVICRGPNTKSKYVKATGTLCRHAAKSAHATMQMASGEQA